MTDDEKRVQETAIARDLKELYPSDESWHRSFPPTAAPKDEEGRRLHEIYNEVFPLKEADKMADDKTVPPDQARLAKEVLEGKREITVSVETTQKEALTNVNNEQKARINQMLGKTALSKELSGASEVTGEPRPNEPTPIEKAKDIGQDLNKAGVTLDRE